MKRLVAATLCLIVSHAHADMVVEYRSIENVMMMGRADVKIRTVARQDRSRVERWTDTPEGKPEGMIEITRADRHVHWSIYPRDHTYIETIWPDTTGASLRATLSHIDSYAGLPDSLGERMRAMTDQSVDARHAERDTINGFPVEHYVITSRPRKPIPGLTDKGFAMGGSHDVWMMTKHPQLEEILHLFDVLEEHLKGANPTLAMIQDRAPDQAEALRDSIRGVPVRAVMRMQMFDSTSLGQFNQTMPDSTDRTMGELFDPKTGQMLLSDMEMTSLRVGPVEDKEFDLPAGYKNLSAPEPSTPTPKRRPRR